MKCAIIDACFPVDKQSFGMGATWLKYACEQHGADVVSPYDADVILISCVDPRNWNVAKRVKAKFKKPVVCGGPGAYSPYSLGMHADVVCVGNGERFIRVLCTDGLAAAAKLPEAWVDGESRTVEVANGFPWHAPAIQTEDKSYKIWCGKGCKKKCYFCHTGWGQTYEENPAPSHMVATIKALQSQGKKVSYLSNDPMQHTFWSMLPKTEHGSYSVDFIRKSGLPPARQVRLGVEGVSERLRKYINKPISSDDLVKCTAWLCENKKSVRWFLIAGLPTETQDDWEEFKQNIVHWKTICSKGVLALSFTAWQPEPSTPLGIMPLDDAYYARFESFREWFFSGTGWSNRIKLMSPANPATRLESAIARMGLLEHELRAGGNWGPNDRVVYPHKDARNKISQRLYVDQR